MNPSRINLKRSTPKHIIIKLSKDKDKMRILKTAREKQIKYKGSSIRLTANFLSETMEFRKQCDDILKILKEKIVSLEFCILKNYLSKMEKLRHSQISKSERIYHYQTCPTRNANGSLSGRDERALDSNLSLREERKSINNGNYIGKLKRQHRYILFLTLFPLI